LFFVFVSSLSHCSALFHSLNKKAQKNAAAHTFIGGGVKGLDFLCLVHAQRDVAEAHFIQAESLEVLHAAVLEVFLRGVHFVTLGRGLGILEKTSTQQTTTKQERDKSVVCERERREKRERERERERERFIYHYRVAHARPLEEGVHVSSQALGHVVELDGGDRALAHCFGGGII